MQGRALTLCIFSLAFLGACGGGSSNNTGGGNNTTPVPTVSIQADSTEAAYGVDVELTWQTSDATSCSASGSWIGDRPTTGSEQVRITESSTFALDCDGLGGNSSSSVEVGLSLDQNKSRITGQLVVPTSASAESFTIVSLGRSSSVTSAGEFTVDVYAEAATMLMAMRGDGRFALMNLVVNPAASGQTDIEMTIETTAASMVFLSPAILTTDPDRAAEVLGVIESTTEMAYLANVIGSTIGDPAPLENATLADALQQAIAAVITNLQIQGLTGQKTVRIPSNGMATISSISSVITLDADLTEVGITSTDNPMSVDPRSQSLFGVEISQVDWIAEIAQLDISQFASAADFQSSIQVRRAYSRVPSVNSFIDQKVIPAGGILRLLDIDNYVSAAVNQVLGANLSTDIELPDTDHGMFVVRHFSGTWRSAEGERQFAIEDVPNGAALHEVANQTNMLSVASEVLSLFVEFVPGNECQLRVAVNLLGQVPQIEYGINDVMAFAGSLIGGLSACASESIVEQVASVFGSLQSAALMQFNAGVTAGMIGERLAAYSLSVTPLESFIVVVGSPFDVDEDGVENSEEEQCGSDPNDIQSVPIDFDQDGACDQIDEDDDNDGTSDADELACGADPLDPIETCGNVVTPAVLNSVTLVNAAEGVLAWTPSDSASIIFQVFRNGVQIAETTEQSYSDTNLLSGVDYCYQIVALNSSSVASIPSNELCVSTGTTNPGIFPPVFGLAALDGTDGFVINGIDVDDESGWSVSSAGDVNADGVDDLIIGARQADPNGIENAGESYVVFGRADGFPATFDPLSLDGSNGFTVVGRDVSDNLGRSVSSAGDVNGDGIDDLIIGADMVGQYSSAGEAYVVFGRSTEFPAVLELSSLSGSNGFSLTGDNGDYVGTAVSGAGDVNSDGFDDLIIGAPFAFNNGNTNAGEVYIIYGHADGFPASLDLSLLDGSSGSVMYGGELWSFYGDTAGFSVSNAGDINADGFDDVIIGASGRYWLSNTGFRGGSYVVFGSASGMPHELNLPDLDGTNGFALPGISSIDSAGISVSGAGDVNGDGIPDLLIGAYEASPNGRTNAGEAYIVFGSQNNYPPIFDLSSLNGNNGFAIHGLDNNDGLGLSVSDAGDVNADGVDDLIIGAPNANFMSSEEGNGGAGASYVVFGRTSSFSPILDLLSLDGSNGFVLNGIDAIDFSGYVSSAGDVNGDGVDDLIIGGYQANPNGNRNAGESYVVYGRSGGTQ